MVTLADYTARVETALRLAERGAATPSADLMGQLRAGLGLPLTVGLTEGRTVDVPADPVLDRLAGTSVADFRSAGVELRVLRSAATSASQRTVPDPDRLRADLATAYRGLNPKPSLAGRIRTAFGQAFAWVLARIFTYRGTASLVLWLVIALGLGMLVFLTTRRLGLPGIGLVPDRSRSDRDGERRRSPADWNTLADAAIRRGDRRAAVRALYGGLLARLSARGIVPDLPSLTAGECRQAVAASRPALAPLVGRATAAFERVSYGAQPVSDSDLDELRRAGGAAEAA
jgi:hypothetical protein